MKKTILLSLNCLFLSVFIDANAQQIYTNGPLSTGATSNSAVAAPAGYTWSELQHNTGNTTESNGTGGISATYTTLAAPAVNNALADNFIVPVGSIWNITGFDFFAYQTGSPATLIPFDQLRVQIYNGDPAAGGTVIAGNFTANVLNVTDSGDSFMFRLFNSTVPVASAPGTTRKIWRLRGNLTATLPAGAYWVAYQAHCTNDGTGFFPPVTIAGTRGLPGWNAKLSTIAVPAYTGFFDTGNPTTAPDVNQDFPFIINGTVVLGLNENTFAASISLSPNPVKNILSISVTSDTTISAYEIFGISGKVVSAMNFSIANISEINVSELAVGSYILLLKSDKGVASKKFIKE